MQSAGHHPAVAHDGPSAIAVAGRFKPDVVLLDIGLPGMNGFEVARALKAAPETRACVLIAVSGYGQTEDQQRSREVGFDHHLVKPADFSALERILDTVRCGAAACLRRAGRASRELFSGAGAPARDPLMYAAARHDRSQTEHPARAAGSRRQGR